MFKHWLGIIGAVAVSGALLVGGFTVAQAATGGAPWYHMGYRMGPITGSSATPGSYGYGMMGPQGGMMGNPNSPNMMNGYTSSNGSSATQTPITGESVSIQNFAYHPANLQVKVGTTVTWTNQDTAPHTVTFRDNTLTSSGLLQKGAVYRYTFTHAGTFTYYCQVHPAMTAQVVVTA
jgi:plastocyanin